MSNGHGRGGLQCLGGEQHGPVVVVVAVFFECEACRKGKLRLKKGKEHKSRRDGLRQFNDGHCGHILFTEKKHQKLP